MAPVTRGAPATRTGGPPRLGALVAGTGLAVLATAALGLGGGAAYAEAPSESGWWAQSGPSLPATPSSTPSDVPQNGLLIQGGAKSANSATNSGATAYAAVAYEIPQGASVGNLTLTVAPNSATTPKATLELCPLTSPSFATASDGSMSDAPAYSCKTHVSAGPSSDGKTYQIKVSSLVSNGSLALAILPTAIVDRVVLSQPSASSLAVSGGSAAAPSSSPSFAAGAPVASGGGSVPSNSSSVGVQPSSPGAQVSSAGPSGTGSGVSPAAPAGGSTGAAAAGASPSLASPSPGQSAPARSSGSTPAAGSAGSSSGGAQFAASTSRPSGANPIAVGLLIGAVVVGGGIWLAVGRAASRAALQGDGGSPAEAEAT